MESEELPRGIGITDLALLQHDDLVGRQGWMRQSAFGNRGKEAAQFEWDGKQDRLSVGQPDPWQGSQNNIWRIFNPRGVKAECLCDLECEFAQRGGGTTKVECFPNRFGLAEGANNGFSYGRD